MEIKHDGIITRVKIMENKKEQALSKKIAIIEVPYKITKEYLESIQNWDSKTEEERSELHGD